MKIAAFCIAYCVFNIAVARADLLTTVTKPQITGQKVVIKLEIKNRFSENVQSARATLFLLDEQNKTLGRSTRWVIGGTKDSPVLATDKTVTFNFVITLDELPSYANLQTKVVFNRIVLEGGKLADPKTGFEIKN